MASFEEMPVPADLMIHAGLVGQSIKTDLNEYGEGTTRNSVKFDSGKHGVRQDR